MGSPRLCFWGVLQMQRLQAESCRVPTCASIKTWRRKHWAVWILVKDKIWKTDMVKFRQYLKQLCICFHSFSIKKASKTVLVPAVLVPLLTNRKAKSFERPIFATSSTASERLAKELQGLSQRDEALLLKVLEEAMENLREWTQAVGRAFGCGMVCFFGDQSHS